MRRLTLGALGIGFALALPLLVNVACGDVQSVNYGNPNSLERKNLPGEGGTEALVCTGDAGASGDGGCPSFATDIYPLFTAGGKWRCSDKACHGGTTAPAIDGGSPGGCLDSLKKITVTKLPYVPSDGGKDPNGSAILCNLQGSCGSRMPQPPGQDPTSADLCKIEAWLRCGAPNN